MLERILMTTRKSSSTSWKENSTSVRLSQSNVPANAGMTGSLMVEIESYGQVRAAACSFRPDVRTRSGIPLENQRACCFRAIRHPITSVTSRNYVKYSHMAEMWTITPYTGYATVMALTRSRRFAPGDDCDGRDSIGSRKL